MKKKLLFLLYIGAFISGYSQNTASCDDETFRHIMRNLVSKGNLYYETSDRLGIIRMADSIRTCLHDRSQKGILDKMDSLEYAADLYKLLGSYHYENSYYDSASLRKAQINYQEALKIYRKESAFDGDLRCEPMIHRELAQLYYKQTNYQEAYNSIKAAYDAFKNAVNLQEIDVDDPDYLDIQTQMAICLARMGKTEEAVSMMDMLIKGYQKSDARYGEALRKKAKILMLQDESGGKAGKTIALDCYKKYFELKKKDALDHFTGMSSEEREMYWMRIRPFVTDCYRLEDADAGFLYDVTLFAKGLLMQLDSTGGGKQNIHATWQMIQEKLKPDACAIEFVQYEKYDKQQMGALVLKKTGAPMFIKMITPDSVMNYKLGDRSVEDRINGTGRNSFYAIDRVYNDSSGLYRLIWNDRLLSAIGKSKKIYFASDGYTHRLAIEYMLPEEASHFQMYRLSSTRQILKEAKNSKSQNALIIGDIDYDEAIQKKDKKNDALAYNLMKGYSFSALNDSRIEIDSIILYRNNPSDSLLTKEKASEYNFKTLCGSYQIIHLSTHGKFNAKSKSFGTDLKSCLNDESLSENIIALAGINRSLMEAKFDPYVQQDGVLSAKEIASLNLNGTQLIVLACCESGLGYVTADGVYGIQRGLKNAGAGAIVMSFWEAESGYTTKFMVEFYKRIARGENIHHAFYNARGLFLSDEEPSSRNVFVLIDAVD